ncbi:MAG: peptidoglycan-binding domain-containing protein [Planctomycetota bacterium]|jgi:peptidoglycan hydrolase-like protein with peptidoglycan-binding domain
MTPAQLQQLQDPYGIGKMAAGFGVSKPGSPGGAAATPKAGKKGISKTAKQKSLLRRADAFGGSLQRLQQFLGNSGYFGSPDIRDAKETFRKGPQNPDGKYGEETEEAIKYLQKILGVKQDGWYGKETHKAWKASNWKRSPEGEAASAKAKLANPKRPAGKGLVSVLGRAVADAEKEN